MWYDDKMATIGWRYEDHGWATLGCYSGSLLGYICYSSHDDKYELRIDDGVRGTGLGKVVAWASSLAFGI